jgi:threonyl-tRNA synthetase
MELSTLKPRHSLAHILAQAVQRTIDAQVQLGTGPAIDTGFYYDMKFSEGITLGEEDLKALTTIMQGIVKENQQFLLFTASSLEQAKQLVKVIGQTFKIELLDKFAAAGIDTYTFYLNVVNTQMLPRLEKNCKPEYIHAYTAITERLREA